MKFIFSTLAIILTITFGISQDLWINEFDYDNPSTDDAEFIELAGTIDLDLSPYTLLLVNGGSNTVYGEYPLSGTLTTNGDFGFYVLDLPTNGFQNGGPDGLALVLDDTNVVEFISYEGTMTDVQLFPLRPDLYSSTDVGVDETNHSGSIQLIGNAVYPPFNWSLADPTPEALSIGQNPLLTPTIDLWISEIDYDMVGSVEDSEFVEVTGLLGLDLSDYSLYFVNGSNGTIYETFPLAGTLSGSEEYETMSYYFPLSTIQNGSPDGIALVKNDTEVIEFLSYEGNFTDIELISGSSDLYSSIDIEVSDNNSTDISVQLVNGVWVTAEPTPTNVYTGVVASLFETSEESSFSVIQGGFMLDSPSDIVVYNLSGQSRSYANVTQVTDLHSGVYIIHIVTEAGMKKAKIQISQ
jgi:hypothetical protein